MDNQHREREKLAADLDFAECAMEGDLWASRRQKALTIAYLEQTDQFLPEEEEEKAN